MYHPRLLIFGFLLITFQLLDIRVCTAAEGLQPLITTSELNVGENRFAFGLAKKGALIENAEVLVRVYDIGAAGPVMAAETNAPYRPVQSGVSGNKVHRHADGTTHVHTATSGVRGIYVTQLKFSRAGEWGIEIVVRYSSGIPETARLMVRVNESSTTPSVGSLAPKSRNFIADDVVDLRRIDTSERPDRRLHQTRIADAIAMGKPQLIVFATPQFCTSRMCGPVVDIVRSLWPTYGKRVAFIHQEIWEDFATKKMFQTVDEWRLQSEPWIFIVDGRGIIRARFEGLVTETELERALQQLPDLS